jgi:hypothetical protein
MPELSRLYLDPVKVGLAVLFGYRKSDTIAIHSGATAKGGGRALPARRLCSLCKTVKPTQSRPHIFASSA